MNDDGVTDVLGSILLVGITVSMMVGLSLLVLSFPAPETDASSQLVLSIGPGGGGWGGGDEIIGIRHMGGAPVQTVRLLLSVEGVDTTLTPADQGFADGRFKIGETWSATVTIPEGAAVRGILVDAGLNRVIAVSEFTARGTADLPPPPSILVDNQPSMTMTSGTATGLGNLTGDDGIHAILTESTGLPGAVTSRLSATVVATAVSVGTPSSAFASDDADAKMNNAADLLGVSGFNAPAGTIQSVKIGIEAAKHSGSSDDARLSYLVSGIPGTSTLVRTFNSGADQTHVLDITADRAWSKAAIDAMEVRVQRLSSAQELRVDHLFVEVTYLPPETKTLEARVDFTNVQDVTGIYTLELEYAATGETFHVEVWDWVAGTYNTRGASMAVATMTPWSYTLAANEVNTASDTVRLRIVDASPSVGPGALTLDYIRVVST